MTLYADKTYNGAYPWKLTVQKHYWRHAGWQYANEPARFFRTDLELEEYLTERSISCDASKHKEYIVGIVEHEQRGVRFRDPLLHHSRRLVREADGKD